MVDETMLKLFQELNNGYTEEQNVAMRRCRKARQTLNYTAYTLSLTANRLYGNAASNDMGAKLELNNIKHVLHECDDAMKMLDELERSIAKL